MRGRQHALLRDTHSSSINYNSQKASLQPDRTAHAGMVQKPARGQTVTGSETRTQSEDQSPPA